MKKLIADVHTHTLASGHAYGTIREMAQAASEKKLKILGITEHAPGTPGTADPIYFCNLQVIPRTLYGVHLLHGCWIMRSMTVGIPSLRTPPSGFGISTRLTGDGVYFPFRIRSVNS